MECQRARAYDVTTSEPARIAQAWQTSNLVLLGYGHRRAPTITAQMDAVLGAIRAKNATVPIVVDDPENPDRAGTETIQRENTQKIRHGQARIASQRSTSTAPSWPTRHHATPW